MMTADSSTQVGRIGQPCVDTQPCERKLMFLSVIRRDLVMSLSLPTWHTEITKGKEG